MKKTEKIKQKIEKKKIKLEEKATKDSKGKVYPKIR